MKLYYTPGACSLAVHIILNELHLDYDLEKVDIKTHQTETGQDFFKINPKGAVPTLELSKDVFLTEIVAILPFLAELDPNKQMIPNMGLERARVLEWLGYLSTRLHKSYSIFFAGEITDEERKVGIQQVDTCLTLIDHALEQSEYRYLSSDHFGPADAYLFVLTSWSAYIKHDLTPYKNIRAFSEKISQRQSVKIAMKKEGLL